MSLSTEIELQSEPVYSILNRDDKTIQPLGYSERRANGGENTW
jgi:hypothetical protein